MSFIFLFQKSSAEMKTCTFIFVGFSVCACVCNRILELYMSMFFTSVRFILHSASLGITHECGCYGELKRLVGSKPIQSSEAPCSGSVAGQKTNTQSTIGMMFS